MKKLLLAILLVAAGTSLVFATGVQEGPTTTGGDNSLEGLSGPDLWFYTYDPPVEISYHVPWTPNENYGPEENTVWNWIRDTAGIEFRMEFQVPDWESTNQRLNIALASGEVPDRVHAYYTVLADLYEGGVIRGDIDDLIEEYGSPLTKYILEQFASTTRGMDFAPFTSGDAVFGFPVFADPWAVWAGGLFMRLDIIKELGFDEAPTTIEEYEAVLAAFKAEYPDVYPHTTYSGFNGLTPVYEAFGATGEWIVTENGLESGLVQDNVKDALAKLRDWYAAGYINPEFAVLDMNAGAEQMLQGRALSYDGPWWSPYWPLNAMPPNIEAAAGDDAEYPLYEMAVVPLLDGPQGQGMVTVSAPFTYGFAISTQCEHPEAFIFLLNYTLDSMFRQYTEIREVMEEEYGYEFFYDFIEGLDANSQAQGPPINRQEYLDEFGREPDGVTEAVWDFEQQGPRNYFNDGLHPGGAHYGFVVAEPAGMFDMMYEPPASVYFDGADVPDDHPMWGPDGRPEVWQPDPLTEVAIWDIWRRWKGIEADGRIRVSAYTGSPTAGMLEYGAFLQKIYEEAVINIIMGEEPLSAYDEFIEQWYANGGTQITEEVNDWYRAQ